MGIYIIHFDDKPWEDLDDVLNPYTISDIQVNGEIYVLVYSPDYETYPNGEKIEVEYYMKRITD